jgi:thiol-disulfide isomerase/thioredoxin
MRTGIPCLKGGYRLLNDDEAIRALRAQWTEQFPRSNQAFRDTQEAWRKDNPYAKVDDPVEKQRAFAAKSLATAREWTTRWPHHPGVWDHKLSTFYHLKDASPDELAATADKLIETYEANPDQFRSYPPLYYRIGEIYLIHNTRLDRIADLFERGTKELEEVRRRDLDDDFNPRSKSEFGNYGILFADGYPLLFESYLRRRMCPQARKTILEAEAALEKNPLADDADERMRRMYRNLQANTWTLWGRLAEDEGRKADAIAAYSNSASMSDTSQAVYFRPYHVNIPERLKKLWAEVGGTEEGLSALLQRPQTEKKESSWQTVRNTIPEFEIADLSGRTWRLTDLKGKRTLVNVWATWCGPCVHELPAIQKLYERLKNREGIQVLTFNVDENPGEIAPFLKQGGLDIPVLPAKNLVDKLIPLLSIPRTWVVNQEGVVTRQTIGFRASNVMEDQLIDNAIKLLEGVE